ncbi:hypothetical protein ACLOJK_005035 [Asimina triloba]
MPVEFECSHGLHVIVDSSIAVGRENDRMGAAGSGRKMVDWAIAMLGLSAAMADCIVARSLLCCWPPNFKRTGWRRRSISHRPCRQLLLADPRFGHALVHWGGLPPVEAAVVGWEEDVVELLLFCSSLMGKTSCHYSDELDVVVVGGAHRIWNEDASGDLLKAGSEEDGGAGAGNTSSPFFCTDRIVRSLLAEGSSHRQPWQHLLRKMMEHRSRYSGGVM